MNDNIFPTSYKKSLGKNYMIIDTNDNANINNSNFRIRMIHENNITGLLNTHVQYVNDTPSFQYDITGLQSLEVILDTSPITYPVLCKIFSGIYNGLLSLENYLLTHDHVILSPEYVYVTADYSDVYLCYYPLKEDSFITSVRSFFDYILKKVDHKDEKCVYLAYSMHRYCNDSCFNLNELYNKLSSTQNKKIDLPVDEETATDVYTHIDFHKSDVYSTSHSIDKSNYSVCDDTYDTDINNTPVISNKKMPDKRIISLIAFIIIGAALSTTLYILEVYPVSFYLTLLITLLIITCYNGYHLYRQQDNTPYVPTTSIKPPVLNSGTVLLTSSEDDNTHKLIYTGTGEGADISITHFPFVIGKTDACSAKLQNSVISRLHAKLTLLPTDMSAEDIFIEDLNSTNGTLLNNVPLTPYEKYPITSGDYITFGHLTYIFR